MIRHILLAFAALLALPAAARPAPLVDCPLRDAPFSIDSPLVDILLNPKARALALAATGADPAKAPPIFTGTTPPTFAAILTIKEAAPILGGTTAKLPDLDRQLRALPVTRADKVARCARYDTAPPHLTLPPGTGARLLLFEKINGFRDVPSVNAAHAALVSLAATKGWRLVSTDRGAAFNPETLGQFDAVIWNNISGDVLTLSQRRAFQAFLAQGGGYVGVHGSAGDPVYFWDWYPDTLLGARFAGHPMNPQFQQARIATDQTHPLATGLPPEWRMTDEWYSFKTNPRTTGARVVLTLDETTYTRKAPFFAQLDMGPDHPLAWTRCLGKGRVFYSAIGHRPETYSQPEYTTLLTNAITWAAAGRTGPCT